MIHDPVLAMPSKRLIRHFLNQENLILTCVNSKIDCMAPLMRFQAMRLGEG